MRQGALQQATELKEEIENKSIYKKAKRDLNSRNVTAENLEMNESKSVSVKSLNEAAMEFNHARTDSQFVNEYLAGS